MWRMVVMKKQMWKSTNILTENSRVVKNNNSGIEELKT